MSELFDIDILLRAKQEGMSTFKEAEGSLLGVAQAALTVGGILAAGFAGGVVAAEHNMEETGHAAYEMSQQFGLGKEKAQLWVEAAKQVGLGAEQLSTGFKFLGKNVEGLDLLNNAAKMKEYQKELNSTNADQVAAARSALAMADASRPMQQVFDSVGIATHDAAGNIRPLSDLMLDVATRFQAMPDGAEKAGLAVKLFGRSGTDLIPILNQGAAGILELMQNAKDSGAVLSGPQVDAANAAFEAHKKFDMAMQGLSNTIAIKVLPYAIQLLNWLTPLVPKVADIAVAILNRAIPAFEGMVAWIQKLLPPIERIIPPIAQWASQMWQQVAPALQDISKRSGDFKPILEAVAIVIGIIVIVGANLIVWLIQGVDWILKTADAYKAFITGPGMQFVNDTLVAMAGGIRTVVGWFQTLWDIVRNVAGAIGGFASTVGNVGGATLHLLGVPGFAEGGIVPGPIGQPMLAMVHGGERVQTPEQQRGTSNITIYVQGASDPNTTALLVANRLARAFN